MGPSRSCWNGRTSALQPEEITSKGIEFHECTINKSAHTKKSGKLFHDPRIYIYVYLGSISSLMQISFNIIDILCLHIFFWIHSNSLIIYRIYRITFKSKRHNLQRQRRPYTVVIC